MRKMGKTILFQGDSITDGGRIRNGDPHHVLGHSYAYILAAQLGYELVNDRPNFINRGISGNRVPDLNARWNKDAVSHNPDLISILIGVNDVYRRIAEEPQGIADGFERDYHHLLEETKKLLPQAGIILCEPFVLRTGSTADIWEQLRARLDVYGKIVSQLAVEFQAVFIPLQDPFDKAAERDTAEYWIPDGVHPSAAGHELIAREWLTAVQKSSLAI